jgi:hypothetical protein
MMFVLGCPAFAARLSNDDKLAGAMNVYHKIEDMASFNIPVDAATLRRYIHPALTLDLDSNNQAWVTFLSSSLVKTSINGKPFEPYSFSGLSVRSRKQFELQVRTHVTGPDPKTGETIKGFWVFDIFLSELPMVRTAQKLFEKSIYVANGNIEVSTSTSKTTKDYTLQGSDLWMRPSSQPNWIDDHFDPFGVHSHEGARTHVVARMMPSSTSGEWFLNRDAYYGWNEAGELIVSMVHGQRFDNHLSDLPQMEIKDFTSTMLGRLGMFNNYPQGCFNLDCMGDDPHPEGAFYVGGMEATWSKSVVVKDAKVAEDGSRRRRGVAWSPIEIPDSLLR